MIKISLELEVVYPGSFRFSLIKPYLYSFAYCEQCVELFNELTEVKSCIIRLVAGLTHYSQSGSTTRIEPTSF